MISKDIVQSTIQNTLSFIKPWPLPTRKVTIQYLCIIM